MPTDIEEIPSSRFGRGNLLLLAGGLIGVAFGVVFVGSREVCSDLFREVLTAHDPTEIRTLGPQVTRLGVCQLGISLAGICSYIGLSRVVRIPGLSWGCTLLILFYGIMCLSGAFAVWQGTGLLAADLSRISNSNTATSEQLVRATVTRSAALFSTGWILLASAQVTLLTAGIFQVATRLRFTATFDPWPVCNYAALTWLLVSGLVVSTMWFRYSSAISRLGSGAPVKATEVVGSLQGVLFCSWIGSGLFLGHALLMWFLASHAAMRAGRVSIPDSISDELGDAT